MAGDTYRSAGCMGSFLVSSHAARDGLSIVAKALVSSSLHDTFMVAHDFLLLSRILLDDHWRDVKALLRASAVELLGY